MNLYTQIPTLKRFLNRKIRSPKSKTVKILPTGVRTVLSEFKNKKVIDVVIETKNVFNRPY